MEHYSHAAAFTLTHAQSWVHKAGYNMHSASPAITALKKGGCIEQVGPGKFSFKRPLAPGQSVRTLTGR
jgi:hypothetical protein